MQREPGHELVAHRLDTGILNAVNLSEVAAKLQEKGLSPLQVAQVVEALSLEIVSCDRELAFRAGALRNQTKAYGLSLGDRVRLATAQNLGIPALTTDRAWKGLKIDVAIDLAR